MVKDSEWNPCRSSQPRVAPASARLRKAHAVEEVLKSGVGPEDFEAIVDFEVQQECVLLPKGLIEPPKCSVLFPQQGIVSGNVKCARWRGSVLPSPLGLAEVAQ